MQRYFILLFHAIDNQQIAKNKYTYSSFCFCIVAVVLEVARHDSVFFEIKFYLFVKLKIKIFILLWRYSELITINGGQGRH